MTSEVMDPALVEADAGAMTTSTATAPSTTATATAGIVHPLAGAFLLADAATTSVNGLAYLAAGGLLADWFGAPESLVRGVGIFLLVFGAGVAVLATRRPLPRRGVLALAALNGLWVVASLDYAVMGDLTTLGTVWTVLQALVVGVFAAGQVWFARKG
jgi:hypothetical protein